MRKPTPEEELKAWRNLAWQIDMQRCITMDESAVIASLNRMSSWVKAHSDHNGERKEAEVQKNVNEAFWTKIAQMAPPPLPEKRGPGRPKKIKSE